MIFTLLTAAEPRHERLETDHGAVHVWVPADFHADGAATVVYVHGYYVDVDRAWTGHDLPEQFEASGVNAVFIACEAPRGSRRDVNWTSLRELLATVHAETGIVRPMGPVVAVGHSGAYRTLNEWLDEPVLDHLILLDATYNSTAGYEAWVRASPHRRLIDVAEDTVRQSEEMARNLDAVVIDRFPLDETEWPPPAQVMMLRAQWSHMELVTGGIVIPTVLRMVLP